VVECSIDWVRDCNEGRSSALYSEEDRKHHEMFVHLPKKLRKALEEFRNVERLKLIKPYEMLFDPETKRLNKQNVFTSR
jgi:hypothetical protein